MCIECFGEGCQGCNERGFHLIEDRNPTEDLTNDGQEYFKAWKWLQNHGQLPTAGGFENQSTKFNKAVQFLDSITAIIEERKRKRDEDNKKIADRFKQRQGLGGKKYS